MDMARRPAYVVVAAYGALVTGCAAALALAGMPGVLAFGALAYGTTRVGYWRKAPSPAVAVVLFCLSVGFIAVRAAAANATKAERDQASLSASSGATQTHPAAEPAIGDTWERSADAFEAAHPDLKRGRNYQIMQAALDRLPPSMSDAELLLSAYAEAKADPAWTSSADQVSKRVPWNDPRPEPPPGYAYDTPPPPPPPAGNRCVSSNGIVYYTQAPCWTPAIGAANATAASLQASESPRVIDAGIAPSHEPPRGAIGTSWQDDRVQDLPGAVMLGPDQALNPYNGHVVQLAPAVPGQPGMPRAISQGGSAQADLECAQARRAGWGGEARSNCAMGLNPDGQP